MVRKVGGTPVLDDLSGCPADLEVCVRELEDRTQRGDILLLSPLAQNYDLTLEISRRMMAGGRCTVIGGNMAPLVKSSDATVVHHGQATPESLRRALSGVASEVENHMDRRDTAGWIPDYNLLREYDQKVPLLRLNASHGCLFRCEFCGDAWSRKLVLVEPSALEAEVQQFEDYFPDTRLIYIGDKTFGQSPDAVELLLKVFANRPQYRFIVQTHFLALKDDLIEQMRALGVVAVEIGFESASAELLLQNRKVMKDVRELRDRLRRLNDCGIKVVLNVLNGLPQEDGEAHRKTLDFMHQSSAEVSLFNLYNFVPYPLTPLYPQLKSRIVDWNFRNWREDGLAVFELDKISREESFSFFLEKVDVAREIVRNHLALASSPAENYEAVVAGGV
ncbi:radical SAM protein [Labrenzia sp. OB1]|uniref:B12-binding domain-containing radical SAM protein n=1 Tax=Labrenzia sp. OB1 TaxID=1561204 RepID=UPI0007B2EB8E|nr:radical SAM protein [Labrenzia sp. OB1]KZM50320.1 hypothetical protein OA90_10480 [Labrenzia sp. OB1]